MLEATFKLVTVWNKTCSSWPDCKQVANEPPCSLVIHVPCLDAPISIEAKRSDTFDDIVAILAAELQQPATSFHHLHHRSKDARLAASMTFGEALDAYGDLEFDLVVDEVPKAMKR